MAKKQLKVVVEAKSDTQKIKALEEISSQFSGPILLTYASYLSHSPMEF